MTARPWLKAGLLLLWACGSGEAPKPTPEAAKATPPAKAPAEPARPAEPAKPVAAAPPVAPVAPEPAKPAEAGPAVAVPEAEVQKLLRPGERVAHAPFSTALGAASRLTLVVVEKDGRLGSFAVQPDGSRVDGPALTTQWQLFEVPAVMFLQADGQAGPDAIVLASCMTGMGPEGAIPFPCNAALTWTDKLVRLPAAEDRIKKATKAAEVKKALAGP